MKKYMVQVFGNGCTDIIIGNVKYMYIFGNDIQDAVNKNIKKIVEGQEVPNTIHIIDFPRIAEILHKEENVVNYKGEKTKNEYYIAKMRCKVSTAYIKESDKYREFEKEFSAKIVEK